MKKKNSDDFINAVNEVITRVGHKPSAPAPEPDKTGFIEPLIFSHETFTLIEGMASHLKALVCNEIGVDAGARIFSLIEQIKQVAADGREEIGATGLSW